VSTVSIETNRLISPLGNNVEEHTIDRAIRPQQLRDYVGQPQVREQMEIFIPAARSRGEALDHLLIFGPPGLGKCITPDSYILTSNGWVEFQQLLPEDMAVDSYVEQETQVYGVNGLETATHVYHSGIQHTTCLQTMDGFEIEGTVNHPVQVASPSGICWKPLGEVKIGEFVAIARGMQTWGGLQSLKTYQPLAENFSLPTNKKNKFTQKIKKLFSTWQPQYTTADNYALPPDLPAEEESHHVTWSTENGVRYPTLLTPALAHFIGLSCTQSNKATPLRITPVNKEHEHHIQHLLKTLFNEKATVIDEDIIRLSPQLSDYCHYLEVTPKKLPERIMQSPAQVVAACIRGLFTVTATCSTHGQIQFNLSSEKMARQLQLLLSNFGIIAKCQQTQLRIGDEHAIAYQQHIGLPVKYQAYLPTEPSHQDTIPFTKTASPQQQAHLHNPHIYWDSIEKLTPGQQAVYDFCVPDTHSFVANGFYNHNTTLANIVANEMGVNLRQTSGPVLEKAGDLAALLTNLEANDVLFIDEIHRLSAVVEEVLYPAMEDYQLDIMIGEGPAARSIKIDLPPFTLIGATTRAGLLTSPLRDRFGITQRLEFYNTEDLARIVKRSADILNVGLDEAGAEEIARRARGTPRIVNRLLRRVRDYAQVKSDGNITQEIAQQALNLLNVDKYGLDNMDRRLLLAIMDKFAGGPVGVDSLAAAIGEDRGTIEDVLEPFLIQQGFIMRTARGRTAAPLAWTHFNRPVPTV